MIMPMVSSPLLSDVSGVERGNMREFVVLLPTVRLVKVPFFEFSELLCMQSCADIALLGPSPRIIHFGRGLVVSCVV